MNVFPSFGQLLLLNQSFQLESNFLDDIHPHVDVGWLVADQELSRPCQDQVTQSVERAHILCETSEQVQVGDGWMMDWIIKANYGLLRKIMLSRIRKVNLCFKFDFLPSFFH